MTSIYDVTPNPPDDLSYLEDELKKLDSVFNDTGNSRELVVLLLSFCEFEEWLWVQNIYLKYIDHPDSMVSEVVIHSLGHLARLSGCLEKEKVVERLKALGVEREEVRGSIEDALDDINIYIK